MTIKASTGIHAEPQLDGPDEQTHIFLNRCREGKMSMKSGTVLNMYTIIGYNESRPDPSQDARTGSHMLVVGMRNNFTSYGGIFAGLFNETSGDFASVTGGYINKASGSISSVSGGKHNTASGPVSSVSGGYDNEASNSASSVSGGESNLASGDAATVSGGRQREASGYHNWVAGELFQER